MTPTWNEFRELILVEIHLKLIRYFGNTVFFPIKRNYKNG